MLWVARGKICTDNVTHIKISNKLTTSILKSPTNLLLLLIKISNKLIPSINYFYDVLFWLCKQKGIIKQPNTSWSSVCVSHNKLGIFIPFCLQGQNSMSYYNSKYWHTNHDSHSTNQLSFNIILYNTILGTPVSSTIINWPTRYNCNIIESGVKHS